MKTMLSLLALAGMLLMAPPAFAQNFSVVVQGGFDNEARTTQSGRAWASTTQLGNDNSAETVQSGNHVYSSIVQIGDGHERIHVQTEDYSAIGSVQVDAMHSSKTWTSTGGMAGGGVTLHFGVK